MSSISATASTNAYRIKPNIVKLFDYSCIHRELISDIDNNKAGFGTIVSLISVPINIDSLGNIETTSRYIDMCRNYISLASLIK